jgi:hypothetical protein
MIICCLGFWLGYISDVHCYYRRHGNAVKEVVVV